MRIVFVIFCAFLFTSCQYFEMQEKEEHSSEIVAIVNTEKLFKEDLKDLLPRNITKEDSLILVKSLIQDWASKKVIFKSCRNQ